MLLAPNDGSRRGRFRKNILKTKSLFYQTLLIITLLFSNQQRHGSVRQRAEKNRRRREEIKKRRDKELEEIRMSVLKREAKANRSSEMTECAM